jgi:rhamnosyltransferase
MMISVVIRTYNEQKHLPTLLEKINTQDVREYLCEVVIVDSGSDDNTLKIAEQFNCRITHIKKSDFSFGRALNVGCNFANGDFLVFISGHCIPVSEDWLYNLVCPLNENKAVYSYGKQIGGEDTKFSEHQVFNKYYLVESYISETNFFCNNANAALTKEVWLRHPFDEHLTGLEDMALAKQLLRKGMSISYCADAPVYHLHDETWSQIRNRYERESYALQIIMPEVQVNLMDALRYFFSAVFHDLNANSKYGFNFNKLPEILLFRCMQFYGTYKGNHEYRSLSSKIKERYFYPKN